LEFGVFHFPPQKFLKFLEISRIFQKRGATSEARSEAIAPHLGAPALLATTVTTQHMNGNSGNHKRMKKQTGPLPFTEALGQIIEAAHDMACELGHSQLTPLHVAKCLFSEEGGELASRITSRGGGDVEQVRNELAQMLERLPCQSPKPTRVAPDSALERVLAEASKSARSIGDSFLSSDTVLEALVTHCKEVERACQAGGLSRQNLVKAIEAVRRGHPVNSARGEDTFEALSKYAQDLTAAAESGKLDPVIGRDEEIRRVTQILSRRTKNNPLLLGEPGVGKTAIAEGLAQRIAAGDVPGSLLSTRVMSLDLGLLIAGASHRGEFEERLKSVLKEIEDANSSVVLFIDEIHTVMGAGSAGGSLDAANLLKPMLARGELRCIGATTLDEYQKYMEKDAAFERRFQPVHIHEPSIQATVSILRGLKERYQAHHGLLIADNALIAAAQLSSRYIRNRFLPDKAIDLVDEACASVRCQLDSMPEALDSMQRELLQLEIEETALAREAEGLKGAGGFLDKLSFKSGGDGGSRVSETPAAKAARARLSQCRSDIAALKEKMAPLFLKYESEKQRVNEQRYLTAKIDEVKRKIVVAERERDLAKVADLRYGALADLSDKLQQVTVDLDERRARASEDGGNEDLLISEVVDPEHIAGVVSRWTGIPVVRLTATEREKVLHLAQSLGRRVVGQDEAVKAVSDAVLRSRSGLGRETQPLGSFLFAGASGCGKTLLATSLASELFDSESSTIRIDCSELQERHSTSKLIGSPPGYIGYEEGGKLTEKVRQNPYSVVLFDEIEKAHPAIFDLLLQVLDDGRLTDSHGRSVDFTNTIIILTSNLGSEFLQEENKNGAEKEMIMNVIRSNFRPEFLNRLDETIIFNRLGENELIEVARLQALDLSARLAKKRGVILSLSEDALKAAVRVGYNTAYGARPLKRFFEKQVITQISRLLLSGELREGGMVEVDTSISGETLVCRVTIPMTEADMEEEAPSA
jgi:ATP-dependent Clp protease ATP-binding subunit ClpB